MNFPTGTAVDPACAYCGRPIIGSIIQGGSAVYHPECVNPPFNELKDNPLRVYPNIFGLDYSKVNTLLDKLILLIEKLNNNKL